jgi:hypothetical protein
MKSKVISHNYTGNSLSVVFIDTEGKFQTKIADSSHANWKPLQAAYKANNFNKVIDLIDVTRAIVKAFKGKFTVKNGKVFRGDEQVHGYLFEKILLFLREGLDHKRLIRFAENLAANTSQHTVNDLYRFLENGNFPITEDGCFLGYKGVQNDFYSITAGSAIPLQGVRNAEGKILNAIGATIEVTRKDVNENRDACSTYGIHVGSYRYAKDFGKSGRLLIVKVNPQDVVAVPTDGEKLRVVKYVVIGEEGAPLNEVTDADFEKTKRKVTSNQKPVGFHNVRGSDGRFKKQ